MDEEIALFDVKHKLSLNLPCAAIDPKAVTAVKRAVEEAASELLDEAPETETRKARIQDASGHSLVRDCPLPAVLASADKNDSPFAIPIYYPKGGSADFGIAFAENYDRNKGSDSQTSTVAPWTTIDDISGLNNLLPFIIPLVVCVPQNMDTPTVNKSIVQAASHAAYCMLRIFPFLSDANKRAVFGDDIALYSLIVTPNQAVVVNVSPIGFRQNGLLSVFWNGPIEGDSYVDTVLAFVSYAVTILDRIRRVVSIPELSKHPKYCWLPLSEYAALFKIPSSPPSFHQTFTNPIIKVDATFYRIYDIYLSKTRDSEVKNLSLECQIQTLQSKSSYHPLLNPFENWTIKKPFMAVPDYGTSLAQLFSLTHLNVTLEKLKNLIQGVFRNSLEPIINLGYCHMDIHLGNICVKDEEGWTDASLIDFDFAALADGRTNNRMARNRLNYPNEECVISKSDVWMVGIVLQKLANRIPGFHFGLNDVKTHLEMENWAKELLSRTMGIKMSGTTGLLLLQQKIAVLRVIAGCLRVDPENRLSMSEIVTLASGWN
ncbi:hypothetical protein HDU79_007384 [Rhizoclosmatium sp. JEL0117]|nr:hypothetical protein HDU79_007384 [Rhizoclosmatium sp. JEL0117]